MALAQRLTDQRTIGAVDFPWGSVPIQLSLGGERRLEAHSFLADGFGIRRIIEVHSDSFKPLAKLADVWQPSRLKGYPVNEGNGLPYLSAGQVMEAHPRVRKWIAAPMVPDAALREVNPQMILMTRSGEVGKVTAVYPEHLGKVITDDLLRIEPKSSEEWGWLYAYMKTPSFNAIARASQYGHMIKHLEPEQVGAMPIVTARESERALISSMAVEALQLRRDSRLLRDKANAAYEELVNPSRERIEDSIWTSVSSRQLETGRRRLEGQYLRREVLDVEMLVTRSATRGVETVRDVTKSVHLGQRFKRFFGEDGTPYRSAGELFDVNAPVTKRIYAGLLDAPERYMLEPGQIIMACSGQTYGLLGRTMVLTELHRGVFGSHDLIRIVPDQDRIATGYLQTVLSNELYGRPMVVRHASGTSIPHLDPVDIRDVPVPRFDVGVEERIAEFASASTSLAERADRLETEAVAAADALIQTVIGVHRSATSADTSASDS